MRVSSNQSLSRSARPRPRIHSLYSWNIVHCSSDGSKSSLCVHVALFRGDFGTVKAQELSMFLRPDLECKGNNDGVSCSRARLPKERVPCTAVRRGWHHSATQYQNLHIHSFNLLCSLCVRVLSCYFYRFQKFNRGSRRCPSRLAISRKSATSLSTRPKCGAYGSDEEEF